MELVQIISHVLLYVVLMLMLVIAISYILSKIKKRAYEETDGHDLVGARASQFAHLHYRPSMKRQPVPVAIRNTQINFAHKGRNIPPNVKLIRKSSGVRYDSKWVDQTGRKTFYPKVTKITRIPSKKVRYTILNEETNGSSAADMFESSPSVEPIREKFANFR